MDMDNKYASTPSRNPASRNHASTNSGLGQPTMPNEGSTSNWMNIYPLEQGEVPNINAYTNATRQMSIRQAQQQPPVFSPQPHQQSPNPHDYQLPQLPSCPMSSDFHLEPMSTQSQQPSHLQIRQNPLVQQYPSVLNSMHVSSQQEEGVAQRQPRQQPLRLSQHQPTQQQPVPRGEFSSSQGQHQMAMERNFPQPQGELKQSPHAPSMLPDPRTIEQQILFQSQRARSELVPPRMVVDSTSQARHVSFESQEEIFQEINSLKEQYFPNLLKLYQRMGSQVQEFAMSGMSSEDFEKSKSLLGETLRFLMISKENVQSFMRDKLPELRRRIIHFTYSSINANTSSSSESRSQQMLQTHFQQRPRQEFLQRLNTQQNMSQGSPQQMRGGSFYMNGSPQLSHPNSPLRYASSPLRISSPSMTIAPSPLSGLSGYSPNVPNAITSNVAQTQVPSSVVGTPGISASPLLADVTPNQVNVVTTSPETIPAKVPGSQRFIKAMQSVSPKAFQSAVKDIRSVVDMANIQAYPAGAGNSGGAMGEDLGETTHLRLQAQSLMSRGESSRQDTRDVDSVPVNILSFVGSPNEGCRKSDRPDTHQVEPAETFGLKMYDKEASDYLLKEIKQINKKWFDMVVKIIEGDDWIYVAASYGEGMVVKCYLNGVAIAPELISHLSADKTSPVIMPLRLLVPPSYPEKSPIVLDEREELDDLAARARSKLGSSMCSLPQLISLEKLATTWRSCAREVITEYLCALGGGTFSTIYGTWQTFSPSDYSK